MVIGLDFDDILMDFRPSLESYHCDLYGVCAKGEQLESHELWQAWGCTKEESIKRVLDFYKSDRHHNTLSVRGAEEALKNLKQNHSLVVITSRPEFTKEWTLGWLERNFDIKLFDQVYFANLFATDKAIKLKSEICQELGVDVFVDDYHVYANDVASTGRRVLLMDALWNQGQELHPNVTRVHSWDQILEILRT